MRDMVEQEVQAMMDLRVTEKSLSEWRHPIVLVPKLDRTRASCIDFQSINVISQFDAYQMPWVDELLDQLGED